MTATMLEAWILEKIEPHRTAPLVIVCDPQRMIQSGAVAVDGWAERHGFTVLFCTGNLALREMYEAMRDDPDVRTLLVDRSRTHATTPLFYPDLDVAAGRRRQLTITLRDFLIEKTGDPTWPQAVNMREYARLLLTNLPNVLAAHAQLRAVRASGFSDADLHKIIIGAALAINPFGKIAVGDIRRIALEHHHTLDELKRTLPEAAMAAWRSALAKVQKPFCDLLDGDAPTILRAFILAALLKQHGLDHRLLLSNLDPQLHLYRDIDPAFLDEALHDQLDANPDRVVADVRAVESYLLESASAFVLLLRDQLQLDDPEHARAVLERERLSPLIRSMALFSLLVDLLTTHNLKFHRGVHQLLQAQDRRTDMLALRRPDEQWLTLTNVYGKAVTTFEVVTRLVQSTRKLKAITDDALELAFFDELWNTHRVNRFDYYASDLERTLRVGALLPVTQRRFWPELAVRWETARRELSSALQAASQMMDAVNHRFQNLYRRHYADWIQRSDAPVIFTHQFLDRMLKAHWDAQGARRAVILIFDGMRTDAFDEFLLPVLEERYRVIARRPGSAILPTETHLSRKAIAAGTLPVHFAANSELELLKRWLKTTWNLSPTFEVVKDDDTVASGMTVRYRSERLEYIIFNFTDKNLHNNDQELALIYDTTVREIIRQDVRGVLRDLPDDALIFVTSDHGFAPVPHKALALDASVVAGPQDVKYRVARTRKRVPDAQQPSVVEFDARTLAIPLTGAAGAPVHSILFPRPGLALQRPNAAFRPDRYTHGGLSMAECFVPMVVLGPPDAQQPLLRIERFVQSGALREGEPVTLELALAPMRIGAEEQVITIAFSTPDIAPRRELFAGRPVTYSMTWMPPLGEIDDAARASGEVRIPVTAIVTWEEGEQRQRASRTLDVRVKLDPTRLRRRVDSKLDLLVGKVPKGLQG
ncbi:MAG TPA: hypothetical protein DCL15_19740 [Chloroflexi bacterium]|nr:hypothetical protein [Chloroflexota bacterium]HHW86160.1 PglZ domain-containing protein [Chloroflexota bacterium]